jgi:hypothetical protein
MLLSIAFILGSVTNGYKKYFAGKRVLMERAAYKTSLGCEVSHIRRYSVLDKDYVCEEVKYLRKPLFHIGNLLAERGPLSCIRGGLYCA